jgi:regulator of RNase E activity RraA
MSTGSALLAQFTALDTATVSDALDACGLPPGQGGLGPMWGRPKVAGFAVTVELEPLSGQPGTDHGGAHILTGAIAGAGPDDVIMVANGGRTDVSSWGGIVSVGAAARRLAERETAIEAEVRAGVPLPRAMRDARLAGTETT